MGWSPGDVVLRREVLLGHPWILFPLRVVEDSPALLATYLSPGSEFAFPDWPLAAHQHPWLLSGHTAWNGHGKLMLHRPGDPYSVDLFWTGPDRAFAGYYFNLQDPVRRHALGFDTLDHELDYWWPAGQPWQVKDEELFEQRLAEGRYTAELGDRVRRSAADLVQVLESDDHWWDAGWERWQPPADWGAARLPEGWDRLPV